MPFENIKAINIDDCINTIEILADENNIDIEEFSSNEESNDENLVYNNYVDSLTNDNDDDDNENYNTNIELVNFIPANYDNPSDFEEEEEIMSFPHMAVTDNADEYDADLDYDTDELELVRMNCDESDEDDDIFAGLNDD